MSNELPKIPDGYVRDARGRLVPIDNIREVDLLRDETVRALCRRAEKMSAGIDWFREDCFRDIDAFADLSAEQYGVKLRGSKGNLTFTSYDGDWRVIVAIDEKLDFDERLAAARDLISQCIAEWTEGVRPELAALVEDAFRADRAGRLSAARVLGLRRLQIADPRWRRAMEALTDSIQVAQSKRYIRFYKRGNDGSYTQIPIG